MKPVSQPGVIRNDNTKLPPKSKAAKTDTRRKADVFSAFVIFENLQPCFLIPGFADNLLTSPEYVRRKKSQGEENMFVSVGSPKMPGGQFLQMGEAPSSFLRADIDLSASVAIGSDSGAGSGDPYFDGYEVELSSGALGE